ncbi:MAG TPA: MMPL family transporter, partial [bacterium]|nr:MMPL family transporter [bacterium]
MLLIIYRSVIAPLVAFVSIGVSYFITAGIVAWLTDFGLTVVDFTQTFIVVVLFGVGTDYCLFIISRFREYMSQPEACGRRESQRAIAHVGETITSSAGTVVVGMVAMAFASLKLFSTTGPALAIGVVITLLAGLTLTPALLSVIGAHTFWPSHRQQTQAHGGFWRKLAQLVTSHPFLPLSFGLFILVPLAIYGQGYTQSYDMMGDLPESLSTRKGFAVLSQHFGAGDMQPLEVVVPGALDARTPAGLLQVSRITGQIGSLEGVADVRSLAVPQGKINPAAADMLTIPGQIMSMVDGFSSLTRSASDNQDNAGFGLPPTGFVALQSYFTDIGTAYPEIAALPEYSQLRQSMDTLITSSVTLEPRLLIPGQLREMQRLLADVPLLLSGDATGTSPEGSELASQFSLFSAYFDEIVAAYPQISSLDSYRQLEEERTALIQSLGASLAGQYASLAGGASLSLTPDQEAAVKDGLTRLSAALGVLADEVETTIPLAMFIPSDISAFGDAAVSLDGLSAELEGFIESLRVLAGEIHARGIETRYLPIALLAGEAKQSFDTLLAMYTAEEGKVSRYQAILTDQPYSEEAMSAVERLRTFCSTETMCTVSGVTATVYDLREYLHQDTVQSTTLVIAGIVVVLVLLLRSLIAPLYLMATIILSYSATLGISRFVFEGILHQELTWWVPFFMFVLLVALGMDYNIFLMGRVKEETAKADTRTGIEQAVEHTGNIITSAGLIMAGTFAALMAGSIIGLIQLGFAITIGVLLDTFVIRTTIVPAIAVLLGRWNWWPGKGPKNI